MNAVIRPPIDANGVGHGGDDLDGALFAFFRSEMPCPWPQLQLPDGAPPAPAARPPVRPAQPAPAPSPRPWFRSPRFALAASVALLIAGSAMMSAALTPPAPSERPSLDGASLKAIERDMHRALPPAEDDGDVGVKIESLDQIGNAPTTINIKVFKNK